MAARLDDRFDLLTSGGRAALPRQQTLRAAMDWSYRLLAPEEQAALHALTVFPADFDLDAAAAVVGADGDDLVFRLVDKSLVTTRAGADEMRYILLETVRAFAAESTHPSERAAARRRHRVHFCRVVTGWPRSTWWIPAWHREVARDDGNLHAAVGSAFDDGDEVAARALLGGMWPYWTWNDRAEALEWLTRALESEGPDLAARAAVTTGLAVLLRLSGAASVERSDELFAEAVALATTAADDRCRCLAQYLRGDILLMSGDCGGARTAYREACGATRTGVRRCSTTRWDGPPWRAAMQSVRGRSSKRPSGPRCPATCTCRTLKQRWRCYWSGPSRIGPASSSWRRCALRASPGCAACW